MFIYELLNEKQTKNPPNKPNKPITSNNMHTVVKTHLHVNNDQNKFWDYIEF